MIAFQVYDMHTNRSAGAVTEAVKAVDHRARVRVDMATLTVEIEESSSTARQLSDTIKRAGYSPIAACLVLPPSSTVP
jgi:copper chaperone